MNEEKIARINALYHKGKCEGLTQNEQKEQDLLRKEYIAEIRNNLRGQLNQIDLQNPDGTVEHLSEKKKSKKLN
ncbi:MAG: DUF896 domain-containing protein [Lachnospiraceae bacterium]